MDREFIGKKRLQWLDDQGIGYIVRIKKNVWVGKRQAGDRASRPGRELLHRQDVFGLSLFFASKPMRPKDRDSHLMVVSNRFRGKVALKIYRQRWGIERLFGHLKKNGFDLEATHMTNHRKLKMLFSMVVLAFVFNYAWGSHLRMTGQKNGATSKRKSLFRVGLEDVLNLLDYSVPPDRLINASTALGLLDLARAPKIQRYYSCVVWNEREVDSPFS